MNSVNINLFGSDLKVQKALNLAKNVAVTKAPVLIVGEAGVGKRSYAAYIHQNSSRSSKSIEVVECNQEGEIVENIMLGYRDEESGHFVRGVLEGANGGSVILANVDGLSEKFQRRLHQIIGELPDYDIDIRFIVTTSKNLSKLVGTGRFYRGLYTLLAGNQISVPPLRERPEDLQMLVRHYWDKYSKETEQELELIKEDMDKILSYYWTHNLKELQSVIYSMFAGDSDGVSGVSQDPHMAQEVRHSIVSESEGDGIRLMSLKEAEKLLIKKALIHTSENRTQAAKILGVSIRTLRNKINEYRSGGSAYFVNLR